MATALTPTHPRHLAAREVSAPGMNWWVALLVTLMPPHPPTHHLLPAPAITRYLTEDLVQEGLEIK